MKVLYIEGLANHIGPESCIGVGVRKGDDEALTGERTGWVSSRAKKIINLARFLGALVMPKQGSVGKCKEVATK